jgi:hypothetical protein
MDCKALGRLMGDSESGHDQRGTASLAFVDSPYLGPVHGITTGISSRLE